MPERQDDCKSVRMLLVTRHADGSISDLMEFEGYPLFRTARNKLRDFPHLMAVRAFEAVVEGGSAEICTFEEWRRREEATTPPEPPEPRPERDDLLETLGSFGGRSDVVLKDEELVGVTFSSSSCAAQRILQDIAVMSGLLRDLAPELNACPRDLMFHLAGRLHARDPRALALLNDRFPNPNPRSF